MISYIQMKKGSARNGVLCGKEKYTKDVGGVQAEIHEFHGRLQSANWE